jgi:hypothetical protein
MCDWRDDHGDVALPSLDGQYHGAGPVLDATFVTCLRVRAPEIAVMDNEAGYGSGSAKTYVS